MKKNSIFVIEVLFLLLTVGCASMAANAYRSYSSGQIGCQSQDIEISDIDQGMYNESWVSTCHGKRYICNRTGSVGTPVKQVSCKEAQR